MNEKVHFILDEKVVDALKGQSHEKVGEMGAQGDSLGPN
jgi:hypothetical protein